MDKPLVIAVSIAARRGGNFLLVERANPPSQGKFAFPGGRAEAGEDLETAARRELFEETGLRAETLSPLETLMLPGENCVYALTVFRAETLSGNLAAGDDALSAGFFDRSAMESLPMSQSTLRTVDKILALTAEQD